MDFFKLLDLIKISDPISIYTHENADADAVGASLALEAALQQIGKTCTVAAPESISKVGRKIADHFSREVLVSDEPPPGDLVIFVDTVPDPNREYGPSAVIDHHSVEGVSGEFVFVDPDYSSASEMVFDFLDYLTREGEISTVNPEMAALLLSGIIADTRGLKLSVKRTLERVVRISSMSRVEVKEVFDLLRSPKDRSLKIACLKGASRLSIETVGMYILAYTEVSSFQGDVASALLRLGADVAFAGGSKKSTISISGRANPSAVKDGVNLAGLMRELAAEIGGKGGGHDGAAALRGKGEVDILLRRCIAITRGMLTTEKEKA